MTDGTAIEPRFLNTRLESGDNAALVAVARAGAEAFGYTATLRLDRQVAQLVRLRVAQINHCAYCLNVHHQASSEAHIDPVKVRLLSAWWETTLFTDRERAALAWTEALTEIAKGHTHEAAKEALNFIDVQPVNARYRMEQGFTFELNLSGVSDEHRDEFAGTNKGSK